MTDEMPGDAPPYRVDFALFTPSPHAIAPRVLCERVLASVTLHVDAVTRWPAPSAEGPARPVEYGCVILYEPVGRHARRVVNLWSEPGQPLVLRVYGHADRGPADDLITPAQRERLTNRGLWLTDCKGYFRRDVRSDPHPGSRELALELLYLLTEGLGYDGRGVVYLAAYRGPKAQPQMLESLGHAELGGLLRGRGLEVGPVEHDGHSGWLVRDRTPFLAVLEGPEADSPGQHRGFGLFAFIRLEPEVLRPVANELRETLRFATAQVHDGEKLMVRHHVRVKGGVSDAHLQGMLDLWRESLEKTGDVIQRHRNRLGLRPP